MNRYAACCIGLTLIFLWDTYGKMRVISILNISRQYEVRVNKTSDLYSTRSECRAKITVYTDRVSRWRLTPTNR